MCLFQDKGLSGHRRFLANINFTQRGSAPSDIEKLPRYYNESDCQAERREVMEQPVLALFSGARAGIPVGKGLICLLLQNHLVVHALGSP